MSNEINKSAPIPMPVPFTPAPEASEESPAPTIKSKTVAPPEFKQEISAAEKEAAQTTLPGSNSPENLSNEDIKYTVKEVADSLDTDQAWEAAASSFQDRLAQQTKLDDEAALDDPINMEWSFATGAQIAQFATV